MMRKTITIFVCLLLTMTFPLAAAPPNHPCEPWPECKNGGGDPPPTPANPAIAYTTSAGGTSLWVMDADGSHPSQIHAAAAAISTPTWAPDGSAIAFKVGVTSTELWRIDVGLVDGMPVGSNPTMLYYSSTALDLFTAEWSPAGDVILFSEKTVSPDRYHLRTVSATGGSAETLYTAPADSQIYSATWSVDALTIAFMEQTGPVPLTRQINTLDVASCEVSCAVTTVYGPVTAYMDGLEWGKSPGSTEIVFMMNTPDGTSVFIMDITLPPNQTLVLVEGGDTRFPSWSPDDSSIAYTSKTPRPKGPKMDWKIWVEDVVTWDRTELLKGWALDWVRCDPCSW